MKDRLQSLLRAYASRPREKGDQSLWQFVAEKDPHLFSHHPADPSFRDHVWKIGGLYFCKGCVMTFCGAVAGIVLFVLTGWLHHVSTAQTAVIFAGLLLPTLLAHGFRWPRWARHAARFLLGVLLVAASLMLFVTDSWFVRVTIVGTYLAVKIPLARLRNRENWKISHSTASAKGTER